MSGHSKWAQIKRQKGVADIKRGQLFTKLGREITVVARQGGPDPNTNFHLRLAVQRARDQNMPMDTVDRAIKRGAGGGEGAALEEVINEGYGPGGTAILIEALTDNRNRTVSEVRNAFTRGGGSLGEAGSVSWLFEAQGVLTIEPQHQDLEETALLAIDAGAVDVKVEADAIEVYTQPQDLERVRRALEAQRTQVSSTELVMQPKSAVFLEEREALQTLRLVERLEELEDVQKVHFNADFHADVLEKMRAAS
jgi:YebC/PmpR family DNA-binding regulatory protein